jgi:Sulfotransferase family
MPIIGRIDEISRRVVTGWAADTDNAEAQLEIAIIVDGARAASVRTTEVREGVKRLLPGSDGRCGFRFRFEPPLSVFDEHSIEVRVASADGVLVPGGTVKLPRPCLPASPLLPVMVTSSGRAGSTILMKHLSQFPEIVMAMAYPFEVKLVDYYSAAFSVLAAPEDREHSTDPGTMFGEKFRSVIGSNPYTRSGHHGDSKATRTLTRHFFDERMPAALAETFRNLMLEYYTLLKRDQDKPLVRYFAEKITLDERSRRGARILFDAVREIVIVRDPRDLLCSAKAFWKVPSAEALQFVTQSSSRLEAIFRSEDKNTILIKYEDLVVKPARVLERVADFLGVGKVNTSESDRDGDFFKVHSTSASPQSSIGRWRVDLSKEEIELCEKRTRSYMETFGYALTTVTAPAREVEAVGVAG